MSELVKRTVDREAQRVGVTRQRLAGWLVQAGWTGDQFLEAAKGEPDWVQMFQKSEPPNPWIALVEQLKAKAASRQQRSSRDARAIDARDIDSKRRRVEDAINCRVFYAKRDFYAAIDAEEERNGTMSVTEYSLRKEAFRRWLRAQYGKDEPDDEWLDRHMKWHDERGTDPW